MSVPDPRPISPEEYLTFERLAATRHEYLDGTVYPRGEPDHPLDPAVVLGLRPEPHSAMAGGTRAHSRIKVNLTVAIDGHLGDGPCRLYDSDLRIRPTAPPTSTPICSWSARLSTARTRTSRLKTRR